MLKLSKISQWLLIVVGIAIVALGFAFHEQLQEQKEIGDELPQIEAILAQPVVDPTPELQVALAEAQTELITAEGTFVDPRQSVEISNSLYLLASSCDLSILEMRMSTSNKNVGDVTYLVLTVAVDLEGEVVKLLVFIDRLGKEWVTAEIESLDIKLAESEDEEDTASIDINIYTSGVK